MLRVVGNVIAGIVLFNYAVLQWFLEKMCGLTVFCVDFVFGSSCKRDDWHQQRYKVDPIYREQTLKGSKLCELNKAAMLAKSDFPFSENELIEKARIFIAAEFGTKTEYYNTNDLMADDFQFVAPVVGPLNKKLFLEAFGSFDVYAAFPDISANVSFMVDPIEPNRVWFITRATGTHTGPLGFGGGITFKATNKQVRNAPQASSLLFNKEGKVYTLTAGYVMDKRIGNTGGLGALFGLLYAIGKPLPFKECGRWTPSFGFSSFERIGEAMGQATSITKENKEE